MKTLTYFNIYLQCKKVEEPEYFSDLGGKLAYMRPVASDSKIDGTHMIGFQRQQAKQQ